MQLLRCDHAALVISATELSKHAQRQASQPLQATSSAILGLLRAEREPDERIFAEVCQTIETIRAGGWNLIVGWLSLLDAKTASAMAGSRQRAARSTGCRKSSNRAAMTSSCRSCTDFELISRSARARRMASPKRICGGRWSSRLNSKRASLRCALRPILPALLRDQGRRREALAALGPLYDWFTEGAGTFDLEQARNVLERFRRPRVRHAI